MDHLFSECYSTKTLLSRFLPNKQFLANCTSVCLLGERSRRKESIIGFRELASITATWWTVWLERIRRSFEERKGSTIGFRELASIAAMWWTIWLEWIGRSFENSNLAQRYVGFCSLLFFSSLRDLTVSVCSSVHFLFFKNR